MSTYDRLRIAFETKEGESLRDAAIRILSGPPHPAWAAARLVVESRDLRDDSAWEALTKALELLP